MEKRGRTMSGRQIEQIQYFITLATEKEERQGEEQWGMAAYQLQLHTLGWSTALCVVVKPDLGQNRIQTRLNSRERSNMRKDQGQREGREKKIH